MKEICLKESSFLKVFISGIPNLYNISNEEMKVLINSLDVEIDKTIREFVGNYKCQLKMHKYYGIKMYNFRYDYYLVADVAI